MNFFKLEKRICEGQFKDGSCYRYDTEDGKLEIFKKADGRWVTVSLSINEFLAFAKEIFRFEQGGHI